MSSIRHSWCLALAVCAGLSTSCVSTVPPADKEAAALRADNLAAADHLLKQAGKITNDDNEAAVYRLRAAEIAWNALDTDGGAVTDMGRLSSEKKHALEILNTATAKVAANFIGKGSRPTFQYSHAGYSYTVSAGIDQKPGIYPLAGLESAKPASEVKRELTRNWHTEDGAGLPVAPKWKRPDDPKMQRFVSSRSYLEPLTAVMTFDGKKGSERKVSITAYDPTYLRKVNLGKTEYPLAADFTAPIVQQTIDINEFKIALTGLIHPGATDAKLMLMEPYDKDRIPVLLVHGLNSHPRMWKDVINDLRADPKLRGRYQFMLFYYPTAWPISYSSMRLREELASFESLVGTPKKMLLIGHSMGGLLSRMQVIDPGRKIWDTEFGQDADKYFAKYGADSLVKRMALFPANNDIGREIYVCTPHRGSGLADLSLTAWFIKLVSLPTTITSAFIDLPGNLVQRGQLTSVAGLSPNNKLFKALDQIPIEVPYHSIIGDRGRGDTPDSSDGVVPYWSSHLEGAQSEKIVPDNHGSYDHPEAIREMRRILLLNAGVKD